MSGFEVIKSGILTLIQDRGRFSYTHLGVTNSGVMDEYAFLVGQQLLENDSNQNTLEIAFSNVELKSNCNTTIAITGASCELFINGILKTTWQTHLVRKNDVIKIGKILSGQRVYLSVKNGFNIKEEFKSNSTTLKEGIGGLNGSKIIKGDFLELNSFEKVLNRRLKSKHIPKYTDSIILRVVLSYQENSFSKEEKNKFFSSRYLITPDFNRMACKLSGEKITSSLDGIISEGISYGSIQIPKDGQPIILLKERQTIGGYPKIGTVLAIDCFKLAQMKIGSYVKFEVINIEEAQKKIKDFYSIFS